MTTSQQLFALLALNFNNIKFFIEKNRKFALIIDDNGHAKGDGKLSDGGVVVETGTGSGIFDAIYYCFLERQHLGTRQLNNHQQPPHHKSILFWIKNNL